jgi:hypothetical protein
VSWGPLLEPRPWALPAETARGELIDRPLAVNMGFGPGTRVKLKTKSQIEVAVQRIVAESGATFGWHTHPGPTIVTVHTGTLTLYHADHERDQLRGGDVLLEPAPRDPPRQEQRRDTIGDLRVLLRPGEDPAGRASYRSTATGSRLPPVRGLMVMGRYVEPMPMSSGRSRTSGGGEGS